MWTDACAGGKRRGHARACIMMNAISPGAARVSVLRAATSLAAGVEHGRRNTIAARVLAAIERGVRDFQHTLREPSLAGWDSIEPAQSKAGGHAGAFPLAAEARLRDRRAQLARDLQRRL